MSGQHDRFLEVVRNAAAREMRSLREYIPASTVPPGRVGPWEVKRREITEAEVMMPLARLAVRRERGYTPPGTYTVLVHDRMGVMMSDTLDEIRDHFEFVRRARGHVLITGLGLGLCTRAVLHRAEVESLTVIEIDADVIALVGPHIADPRLRIVHADAFTWKPDRPLYDSAWHDIWLSICEDNKPEMTRLKKRFGRRAGRQGCWGDGAWR